MKFERQRTNPIIPNKYELNNQQFLTFRNNPIAQNSGRTVYSQQIDYKSLDRYQKPEENGDQNFNFRKNLKNLRSTDKYKQLKEQALLFQTMEENSESQIGSSFERRQELKVKLAKIKKNVKRQQKRQQLLKEQLLRAESDIEQMSQISLKHQNDITELSQILKDNQKNIGLMIRKLDACKNKERELQSQISYLEDTKESERTVTVKEECTVEYQRQLMKGIKRLQAFLDQQTDEYLSITNYNQKLRHNLIGLRQIDSELVNALSK